MRNAADFLVEIGTEELPPKALKDLMNAFSENLAKGLDEARLPYRSITPYASPRRLALNVAALARAQQDRETLIKGPPVAVAVDDAGKLRPAGRAFAQKCGVAPEKLVRIPTDKGERLGCRMVEKGAATAKIMPGLVSAALERLPVPRRMRWGAGEHEFVRPVHWVLMLHGRKVISGSVMGIQSGRKTRGHRFHAPGDMTIDEPSSYLSSLKKANVIADFGARRKTVVEAVRRAAKKAGGVPVATEDLYDEVTALTEWPVALTGRFDAAFLELPEEVIVATLCSHQRNFPVADKRGRLLPRFVTVANLASERPELVRHGNERVILPRLADAAFFFAGDKRTRLAVRGERLKDVVYQHGLGSVHDKTVRLVRLAARLASQIQADKGIVERAATLAKCDLLTGMVGEFPELQGVMGKHYALADGEAPAVADAIAEQYLPRFAGDALPATAAGQALAVADKLDTLAGIFALGRRPTGNRDPFSLRRSALGVVRIAIEKRLELNLKELVSAAVADQPVGDKDTDELTEALYDFITERMRAYYLDRQDGLTPEMFAAVLAKRPESLLDFDARMQAVAAFVKLEPASSLASANKRIGNILKQAGVDAGAQASIEPSRPVDKALIREPAEEALYDSVVKARKTVAPLLANRDYTNVLATLANLRGPVDGFFDDVMVMTDDEALRNNRLALLAELRSMFLNVADVSRLAIG